MQTCNLLPDTCPHVFFMVRHTLKIAWTAEKRMKKMRKPPSKTISLQCTTIWTASAGLQTCTLLHATTGLTYYRCRMQQSKAGSPQGEQYEVADNHAHSPQREQVDIPVPGVCRL